MTSGGDAFRPLGRADLFYQDVSEGGVLFDPEREKIFVLNPTAAFIWTCCDGRHSPAEILEELCEALGSSAPPRAALLEDIDKSLDNFRRQGLLAS